MKRIDFGLTLEDHSLAVNHGSRCAVVILFATAVLVIALFASAASAGDRGACAKQKYGKSGQCYEWKKDC